MKINKAFIVISVLFQSLAFRSQQWSLKLSSNVELRSWILTSRADKKEKPAEGAKVTLYQGQNVISSTMTDLNGDFVMDIPAGGDFILTVTYEGCNTKRFMVTTNGVPENVGKDNYKPTISIAGFVLSKPISGVDYIGLNEPLVKVEYKAGAQNFDKDDAVTGKGLNIISNITQAENLVINKFCENNKLGDEALAKKKCELAREYYTKAIKMLGDERYPQERIKLADNCIEAQKVKKEMQQAEAAEKAKAAELAVEKAKKEKEAKANESFKKQQSAKQNTVQSAPAVNTNTQEPSPEVVKQDNIGGGKSKYRMPGKMPADQFKELMAQGESFFRAKKYKNAKEYFKEALDIKPKDPTATARLAECEKQIAASPSK